MASRPDWCVSRQRLWGVPVVALACGACGNSHTTPELVTHATKLFEKEGADAWYVREVADFIPEGFFCPTCGEKKNFEKERDILDVWFDSGVSYAAVLESQEGIKDQADLYLEGSDQHRGWFHTSLLTSIGTRGRAPYKRVLTHGFVVDGEGRKYSKSAKNYVPPENLINKHGAEILRLWVAAEDYRDDIRFSDEIFTRCIEAYRKLRNTARYMLGNVSDFSPDLDLVPVSSMQEIDRWAISELGGLTKRVKAAYESFEFHVIAHALGRFCTVEMSAFYLDILKDRLYTEKKDGPLRRSAQSALWLILDAMTRIMAPIFSFTADEIWKAMPKKKGSPDGIFLTDMSGDFSIDEALLARWSKLVPIRSCVTGALEMARAEKFLGNSLAAKVVIECSPETKSYLESFGDALPDLFIVSEIFFGTPSGKYILSGEEVAGLRVGVETAPGTKCERCWKSVASVGQNAAHPTLCNRCTGVVDSLSLEGRGLGRG